MDFATLFKRTAYQQSCNSLKAEPRSSISRDAITGQERRAEAALLEYCSFPEVRRLPHRAAIEAQSCTWFANLCQGRLPAAHVERLLATRLDILGCVFYAHGSSDARSLTLSKFIYWCFVLDDVLDDPYLLGHNYDAACRFCLRHFKAMFGSDMTAMTAAGIATTGDGDDDDDDDTDQHSNIVGTAATDTQEHEDAATSFAEAQQDVVIEMGVQWAEEMRLLGMSPRQLERLREGVAEYLAGTVGMVRLRQEKRLPGLDEYIKLRRQDGAQNLTFLGCEFDVGIELDDKTLAHPLIKKLSVTSADQALWLNDLLSFNRECHIEDYVSLLAVLHYNNVCSKSAGIDEHGDTTAPLPDFQEAICEARAMIKAVDCERVRLATQIAAWRPDLGAYVEATHCTISGLTFWALWSQRYLIK